MRKAILINVDRRNFPGLKRGDDIEIWTPLELIKDFPYLTVDEMERYTNYFENTPGIVGFAKCLALQPSSPTFKRVMDYEIHLPEKTELQERWENLFASYPDDLPTIARVILYALDDVIGKGNEKVYFERLIKTVERTLDTTTPKYEKEKE